MPDLVSLLTDARLAPRTSIADITPLGLLFNGLGGVNGALPAPSDTGVGNAWDVVAPGSGCTLQYDNSHGAPQGCQAIQFATGATAATDVVRWTASFGPQPQAWASAYCYFAAFPSTITAIIAARRDADAGVAGSVRITTSGKVGINDANNVQQAVSVNTIPLNQDFRIEAMVVSSNGVGGTIEARLFKNANSSVPDEVISVGGIQTSTGGQNIGGWRYGVTVNSISNVGPFWMWGMQASNVGYPSPLFPTIALSDSSTSLDSIVDSVSVSVIDSGSADDSQFVTSVSLGLSDSSTSTDTVSEGTLAIPVTDQATAADAIVAAIAAQLADSGVGTDTIGSSQIHTLSDSASSADSIAVSVIANIGDLGDGVDAVVQYFRVQDQGQGHDSSVVSVTVSLADIGSGADSIQASQVITVNLSDAGAGTDTLVAIPDNAFTKSLNDSGSASDTISVSPFIALIDTGVGNESVVVTVQMWLGFDDPVPEGHEPFNPEAMGVPAKITFTPPVPYASRTGLVVAPNIWDMPVDIFLAHMEHMHAGRSAQLHNLEHMNDNGEGGAIRHIHR